MILILGWVFDLGFNPHTILTYILGFTILWVILVFMLQRGNGFRYGLKVKDINANFGDGDGSRSSTYYKMLVSQNACL
jgi:hypothetical protein